jgi:[ribosomal protein S18]-alanine N-acetyltransferase
MTFREMTVEDLEQVVEIENRLFSDPWTKEGFFTFLTKENTMFFVIEEKEKILAYCSMQTVLDEGDILNVAVSPDRQREGIGYFLVDKIAETETDFRDRPLDDQQIKSMTVETFGVDYPEPEKC